jgi:hypothetical protein
MSSEVQITLTAVDEATDTINNVANSVNQANTEITDSSEEMSSTVQASNTSVKDTALGFNNMATSGMNLYMCINNIENAQVALDRAHLQVEKATNAVTSAQNAYNTAVTKYGPSSKEAQDALAKLNTAQDGLTVAQERAEEAQRNYNNTIAFSVMTVIPSLITMTTSLTTVMPMLSGAIGGVSDALDFLAANPIILVIAGIAALIVGLVYAYEHCAPFRNAINEVGSALGGAILTAAKDLEAALSFLWNDVLKPIADFLEKVFITALNDAVGAVKPFQEAINAVGGFVKDVSGAIGGLGSALMHLCFVHARPAAEEFNKTLKDSIGLAEALTGKVGGLSGSLAGMVGPAAGAGGPSALAGVAAAARPAPVNVYHTGPMVNIQGSADIKTAQVAAQMVQDKLKDVIIQSTSIASPQKKRIRLPY